MVLGFKVQDFIGGCSRSPKVRSPIASILKSNL